MSASTLEYQDTGGTPKAVNTTNPLPVYLAPPAQADGTAGLAVRTRVRGKVGDSNGLTRPSDTNAYIAKDALADSTTQSLAKIWRFPAMGRALGGGGTIRKAIIATSQTTNVEAFRLHLFSVAPAALADNAQCTAPLLATIANYIGRIDFPACRTEGTGVTAAYAENSYDVLEYGCAADDTALYGILETPNGFTPASAQTFEIFLIPSRD